MAAREDDLEYHVTFPSPSLTNELNDGLSAKLQEKETAVMIIGWLDCRDKYLAKYSKFYEDKGCTTVRFSPSKSDIHNKNARSVARKLLDVVVEMNLDENPVLFHIFSNAGCILYNEMRAEMNNNPDFDGIAKLGVVYDSAPGQPDIAIGVQVYFTHYPEGLTTNLLKSFAFLLASLASGADSLLKLVGFRILPNSIYDEMMFAQDGCPELYLYSTADSVISAKEIEELIERRKIQGVGITAVNWDDSPHVQHLKTHREVYINSCYNFLLKCLKIHEDDTD